MDFIKGAVCQTYSNTSNSKKKKCTSIIFIAIYIFMFLDSSISARLLNFSMWAYINKSHFIFSHIMKISAKLHYILPPINKFEVCNVLLFIVCTYVILYFIHKSSNNKIPYYYVLYDIQLEMPRLIAFLTVFYYLYFRYPLPNYIFPFSLPTICTTIALISDIRTIAGCENEKANQKVNHKLIDLP